MTDPRDADDGALSPRTSRAVATMAARITGLFPGCPDAIARSAALRWSRTCAPRLQEREARVTHPDTVRAALAEEVRWTRTDWPARVQSGRTDPLARRRVAAQVRDVLAAWKDPAPAG